MADYARRKAAVLLKSKGPVMNNKTIAWVFFGGSLVMSAALGVVACSSDSNVNVVPGPDGSVKDTGGGQDTSSNADTSPPPNDGGSAECGKAPTFHQTPDAGPFCPFQQAADGGALFGDCNPVGSHCCIYSQKSGLPSSCNASNSACTVDAGATDFQCEETADCVGNNQVCCLSGSLAKDPSCGTYFGSKVNGTTCRSACMQGEVQICDNAQSTCPMGQTCQPFKTKAVEMGGCTN